LEAIWKVSEGTMVYLTSFPEVSVTPKKTPFLSTNTMIFVDSMMFEGSSEEKVGGGGSG
jgi:hypothetical protein